MGRNDYTVHWIKQVLLVIGMGFFPWSARGADALYVWEEAPLLAESGDARNRLVDFCRSHDIQELYVNAASMRHPVMQKEWSELLTQLHEEGLRVEALLGDPNWIRPGNKEGMSLMKAVLAYQQSRKNQLGELFDGVHLDVEIDSCAGREQDKILWYLAFADQMKALRADAQETAESFPFHWDVGMHYDQAGQAAAEVDYAGEKKPGWMHIFDRMEKITFMSYNDRPRHIAAGLQPELLYLQSLSNSPTFRFAFEFQEKFRGHSLKEISLADEDYRTYLNLRQYLRAMVLTKTNLHCDGFALHYYHHKGIDDVQKWGQRNQPYQEPAVEFVDSEGAPRLIPSSMEESITDPVYVRVQLLADPSYEPQSAFHKGAISFLPVGYGYCSETKLAGLWGYDGLMPSSWYYYGNDNDARWWVPSWSDPWTDLSENGVCWQNPAWYANDRRQGVVRMLVLQRGKPYRFLLAYNDVAGIDQFVAKDVIADKWPGCGDTMDTPMEMTMCLGRIDNLASAEKPHNNSNVVICDQDHDGRSDNIEVAQGTDPYKADSEQVSRLAGGDRSADSLKLVMKTP
jgi:hypothetical protein